MSESSELGAMESEVSHGGRGSVLTELADLTVFALGGRHRFGDAVGAIEADLEDPLWGVIAVWDHDRRHHIVNWELIAVLVDPPRPDEWVRRRVLLEVASGQPLDWELIAAALEDWPEFRSRSLIREQGGRVRAGADGGWVAEHGPITNPELVACCPTIPAAMAMLQSSCMRARAELREALIETNDPDLLRIAKALWWSPRLLMWATPEEVRQSRTWDRIDLVALLDAPGNERLAAGTLQLPVPDQPRAQQGELDRWYQETLINWAFENGLRLRLVDRFPDNQLGVHFEPEE